MEVSFPVQDRLSRKVQINVAVTISQVKEQLTYRNQTVLLPVVRVTNSLPVYRVNNTRTSVEQLEYIRAHDKLKNFFTGGEENDSTQAAQHKILLGMAKDNKGDIYHELDQFGKQTQPLLITAYGVVINGNRRLAAMRDLHTKGDNYKSFGHIDAMVLPEDASEIDIETIESELQEVPNTKLDYGWIESRLRLRYRVDVLNIPRADIKAMYRFKQDEDINKQLQQIDLVDEYLETYYGSPGAYRSVEKSERIFFDLQVALKSRTGLKKEQTLMVAFPLIKESTKLGSRAYDYRIAFGPDIEKVLEELAEEQGLLLSEQPVAENPKKQGETIVAEDDPLSGLFEAVPDRFEALAPALQDAGRSEEVALKIAQICDGINQGKNQDKVRNAALKNVTEANKLLSAVNLASSNVSTFSQLVVQIEKLIKVAEELKTKALDLSSTTRK